MNNIESLHCALQYKRCLYYDFKTVLIMVKTQNRVNLDSEITEHTAKLAVKLPLMYSSSTVVHSESSNHQRDTDKDFFYFFNQG